MENKKWVNFGFTVNNVDPQEQEYIEHKINELRQEITNNLQLECSDLVTDSGEY